MNESFKRQFPSASAPLPTHHPLQLLHWKEQDKQHNTWYLEKYNRLQDSRKQPLSVDCSQDDRLIIQFKEQVNKMISIYHNYRELETFCIHPLLFSHDLISKETRLLFCIKDQIDGSIRYKFRVKFISQDDVISFCSVVAGYVTIKSYEEWSRHSEGARTPTYSERGRTPLSEKGNITVLDKTFETTIINETDASENISSNHPVPREDKHENESVNVHIGNLISVESVREFGNVLLQVVNTLQEKHKTTIANEGPSGQFQLIIKDKNTITTSVPGDTSVSSQKQQQRIDDLENQLRKLNKQLLTERNKAATQKKRADKALSDLEKASDSIELLKIDLACQKTDNNTLISENIALKSENQQLRSKERITNSGPSTISGLSKNRKRKEITAEPEISTKSEEIGGRCQETTATSVQTEGLPETSTPPPLSSELGRRQSKRICVARNQFTKYFFD